MNIYEKLNITSNVAIIIISIALMLFCGFLVTRVTKKLKLPNVTAYILAGVLLGPYVLNLIPKNVIDGMDFLSDIALAFIAFGTGEFFKFDVLKKNGAKVLVITLFESLLSAGLIFIVSFFLLKLTLSFSIVLAALAAATAPASTLMTIRQTGAKGDFVDTLLLVIAVDNIICLLGYGIVISVVDVSNVNSGFNIMTILKPVLTNIFAILLGASFGAFMKILMPKSRSTDNRLIIAISLLFLFCGICALLGISPLLGCMSMGAIYTNIVEDDKLFKQLNYFSPPLLLLFFVRSGLNFNLSSLGSVSSQVGGAPLIIVGVVYFFVRIIGKFLGSYTGSLIVKKNKEVRNYLGMALIPQAGVAIGLASLGARSLGIEAGSALTTIILSSSILYEIVGPVCAKASLYLSHSYTTNLEELTNVELFKEDGTKKTSVELLIERIKKIQDTIPKHIESDEEIAFNEAAEEYMYERRGLMSKRNKNR